MSNVSLLTKNDKKGLKDEREKECIAKIIKVANTTKWDVIDRDGDLCLIHYNEGVSLHHYAELRGYIVDVRAKHIVAIAPPTPIVAVVDELRKEQGKYHITDVAGVDHVFKEDQVLHLGRAFEGVIIRVFKHRGKVYFSTHKKLDCSKSHWANSPVFLDCYKEAQGPTAEELFDTNCEYSPYYYTFLVVHPGLLACTKQQVTVPYIVYLGCTSEWTTCSLYKNVEKEPKYKPTVLSDVGRRVDKPCIHVPAELSLADANRFLNTGYYPAIVHKDRRLNYGESCIIHYVDRNNKVKSLTIHGPSFHWRYTMRENSQSNYSRFLSLTTDVADECTHQQWVKKYADRYILFKHMKREEAIAQVRAGNTNLVFLQENKDVPYSPVSHEDRLTVVWLNYMYTVPHAQRLEVCGFIDKYLENKKELKEWLVAQIKRGPYLGMPERLVHIMKHCKNCRQPLHKSVDYIVDREYGESFNRLLKEMKRRKIEEAKN
jgi:hypothetical protein